MCINPILQIYTMGNMFLYKNEEYVEDEEV